MPAEEVSLTIAGQAWSGWESYQLEADYLVPSDGWQVTARNPGPQLLLQAAMGQPVVLSVQGQPVLVGLLEHIDSQHGRGPHTVTLAGRDLAGPFVDATPSLSWSYRNISLAAVAAKAATELGVPVAGVVAAGEAQVPRSIIKAEAGETYWDVLQRYARKARLGLWMSPTGTLYIGRPDYLSVPKASVVVGGTPATRAATNVLEARFIHDMTGRRSPVTCVGQAAGGGLFASNSLVTSVAVDPELTALGAIRPHVVDDGDVNSAAEATARARFEISRRSFEAKRLEVVVRGHFAAPGFPWAPNQMVGVQDDVHGIASAWWVRARTFRRDRTGGTRTALTLHPPNLYLPAV